MTRRLCLLAILVAGAACSQRSPWRVAHSAVPAAPTVVRGTPKADSTPAAPLSNLPLSTVARDRAASDATATAHLRSLLFPVGGMDSMRLDDSFDDPRDGGVRKHNAIDIMAPRGTPILAVSDGRILRLTKSSKGGLSLYASDLEDSFVYYYAHLDRFHPKLYSGKPLLRGDTLGFVGTTGNAPKDQPHLHFQVMRMPADQKYWLGTPINPYPLLRQTSSSK